MDGLTESESTQSCNSGLMGEFGFQSLTCPSKLGDGPPNYNDFNRPWLLPSAGPPPSYASNIERRGDWSPGSHPRKPNALPTELRRRHNRFLFLLALLELMKIKHSRVDTNTAGGVRLLVAITTHL